MIQNYQYKSNSHLLYWLYCHKSEVLSILLLIYILFHIHKEKFNWEFLINLLE
jgi:hypothetical protein